MDTRRVRSFELVTVTAAEAIANRDRAVYAYAADYTAKNLLTYYVASNTWLNLIRSLAGDAYVGVFDAMVNDGLIAVASRFSDAADEVVNNLAVADPLVADVLDSTFVFPRNFRVTTLGYVPSIKALRLELCRYLKRCTFQARPDLDRAALDRFHETQQRLLLEADSVRRTCRISKRLFRVREVLANALPWDAICSRLEAFGPDARTFTPGAARDGSNLQEKLLRLAQVNPAFFHPVMGSWLDCDGQPIAVSKSDDIGWVDPASPHPLTAVWNYPLCDYAVKVTTAPKNLKGPRIIAMEPVDKQMLQRAVKDVLYDYFPEGMDLNDQSLNQELAFEGAQTGRYATLDLSAASDYVAKWMVEALFPERFVRLIAPIVPAFYELSRMASEPGKYPLASFATMGNGLTFWVESIIFWGICRAATGCAPTVYGDDIIVPSEQAQAAIDWLTSFGFVVNRQKSFISGSYRESCGVEWDGKDCMSSVYYPRFPVQGDITEHTVTLSNYTLFDWGAQDYTDSTMQLVSLQHKLTNICAPAASFVASVVKDAHPLMTTSRYGSESPDLWGPAFLYGGEGPEPYAEPVVPVDDKFVPGREYFVPGYGVVDWHFIQDFGLIDRAREAFEATSSSTNTPPAVTVRHTRPLVYRPHVRYAKVRGKKARLAEALYRHYVYGRLLRDGPLPDVAPAGFLGDFPVLTRAYPGPMVLGTPIIEWGLELTSDF